MTAKKSENPGYFPGYFHATGGTTDQPAEPEEETPAEPEPKPAAKKG